MKMCKIKGLVPVAAGEKISVVISCVMVVAKVVVPMRSWAIFKIHLSMNNAKMNFIKPKSGQRYHSNICITENTYYIISKGQNAKNNLAMRGYIRRMGLSDGL